MSSFYSLVFTLNDGIFFGRPVALLFWNNISFVHNVICGSLQYISHFEVHRISIKTKETNNRYRNIMCAWNQKNNSRQYHSNDTFPIVMCCCCCCVFFFNYFKFQSVTDWLKRRSFHTFPKEKNKNTWESRDICWAVIFTGEKREWIQCFTWTNQVDKISSTYLINMSERMKWSQNK